VSVANDVIYVGSNSGPIQVPDTRTGKELREWEFSNRLAIPRRRRSLLGTGLRYTGGSGNSSWLQRVSAGAVVWLPCARGNRELKAKAEAVGSTVRMCIQMHLTPAI